MKMKSNFRNEVVKYAMATLFLTVFIITMDILRGII